MTLCFDYAILCPAFSFSPKGFLLFLLYFGLHKTMIYTCQLFLRYKREIFILGVLGFLKTTRSFPKILPKTSEVCQRRARSQCFSLQKSEITRKVLPFIHFTHGFRSLHGSELTYFWKLFQAGRQQLTFFNQA